MCFQHEKIFVMYIFNFLSSPISYFLCITCNATDLLQLFSVMTIYVVSHLFKVSQILPALLYQTLRTVCSRAILS